MQNVHSIEIEKKITIQTRSQCYKTAEIPPVFFIARLISVDDPRRLRNSHRR